MDVSWLRNWHIAMPACGAIVILLLLAMTVTRWSVHKDYKVLRKAWPRAVAAGFGGGIYFFWVCMPDHDCSLSSLLIAVGFGVLVLALFMSIGLLEKVS